MSDMTNEQKLREALEKISKFGYGIHDCPYCETNSKPYEIARQALAETEEKLPEGNCPRCDKPWIIHDCPVESKGEKPTVADGGGECYGQHDSCKTCDSIVEQAQAQLDQPHQEREEKELSPLDAAWKISNEMNKPPSTQDFNEWHKTHGPDKEALWYIQNCLGSLYGYDSENAKQAVEAWEATPPMEGEGV